jgi:WD40 repeat protein
MLRLCLLFGLLCTSVRAAEPRKDAEGTPLPDGAVTRLGTTRLRLGSTNQAAGSLGISHDGKRVACLEAGRVHVWEVETGKTLRQFDFPFAPARCECLAISPDGKQVMAASFDGNLQGWDIDTGETVFKRKVSGDTFHWFGLGFRPEGTPLFTQSLDAANARLCLLADAKSGRQIHTFRTDEWAPTSVDILPDGKTFMGGQYLTEQGKIDIRVFAGRDFEQKSACVIDPKEVPRNVGLSPDGSTLICVHRNFKLSFWNPANGKLLSETEEFPEAAHDVPACLSWDGKLAAVSGFSGGTIRLFDTATGKRVKSFEGAQGGGHVAISKDGRRLVHRGEHRVQVWDVATGKEMHLGGPNHSAMPVWVAFRPDGKEIATADHDAIHFWNPWTGQHLERWETLPFTTHVAYSNDGKQILSCGFDAVTLRDRFTGKVVREWGMLLFPLARFHPDGKRLLIWSNGQIGSWDLATGKLLMTLKRVYHCDNFAISPSGERIAVSRTFALVILDLNTLYTGQEIGILNLNTGQEIASVPTKGRHEPLRFDPSGRYLGALRLPDQTWTVFDPTSRKVRQGVALSDGSVKAVLTAPSGRVLAITDRDANEGRTTELKFLDTATGRIRNRKSLPFSSVGSMAFSPDGRYLATGNSDTTVLIWDTWNVKGEFAVPDQVTEEMVREQWEHLGFEYVDNVDWMIQVMCKRPELTVSLLSKKLAPVEPVNPDRLKKLMNELESERFVTRQRATSELTKLGEPVIDDLHRRRQSTDSEDLRLRIESILSEIDQPLLSGERLRIRRGMEILERIKTPEAKELLLKLSKGDPAAMMTREAKAVIGE